MCKDSITITKEQFDEAVAKTVQDTIHDPNLETSMGKFLFTMMGVAFAGYLRKNLFGKSDDTTEEKKED